METVLNKKIMLLLIDEISQSASHSRTSLQKIINTLVNSHPELLFSIEEWDQLAQETKDNIISRIKRTLVALSVA
ncbi:MAG: hypothetical protein H6Q73_1608 [Firmicutes bacterium]|nr:hypothetical protein [Bacillota bacterium]